MLGLPDGVFFIFKVNKTPKPSTCFFSFNDLRRAMDEIGNLSDDGTTAISCVVGMVSSGGGTTQEVRLMFD